MLTRSRARSLGWAVILSLCFALTIALTFRVNAVRSQVRLTERQIIALRTEKSLLETEFETRANQQQLKALNDVEFGYEAPTSSQYLESERQLAALGKPRGPGAPDMIRVAAADPAPAGPLGRDSPFPAMVNPLTGKAMAAEVSREKLRTRKADDSENGLVRHLSHIEDEPRRLSKQAKPAKASAEADSRPAEKARTAKARKAAADQ